MRKEVSGFIKITIWVAIILFSARVIISWETLSLYDTFGYAGEAIALTAVLMGIYEKWLWRYMPFKNMPVLKKDYDGTLLSTFDNKERTAHLHIKQTLFSVKIVQTTNESKSTSISASIEDICGEKNLIYTYINMPQAVHKSKSCIHYGTCILTVNDTAETLTGSYYTDRKTTGDMNITFQSKSVNV